MLANLQIELIMESQYLNSTGQASLSVYCVKIMRADIDEPRHSQIIAAIKYYYTPNHISPVISLCILMFMLP